MPHFDILKTYEASKTFRAKSIVDLFTIEQANLSERFTGSIDLGGKQWNVGLIVGGSGSGKSTIARECFGDWLVEGMEYGAASVIDDMPDGVSAKEAANVFTSVGFASPPSWLKPYGVLSNGEKMRVDLARAIMERGDNFAFDEFTSVVDRRVAQTGSAAIAKAVRKRGGQFVAVTCHHDVTEWLEPDWIYDTDAQRFFFAQANGSVQKLKSMFTKLRDAGAIKSGTPLQSIII
jgi:ABC-type ATPase with predicted acetyltransferase domain